jgi:hypothetical protein
MKTQILSINLVPKNAWGKNVRAVVSNHEWNKLRWHFGASLEQPTPGGGAMCGHSSQGNNYLICNVCERTFDNLHLHELWQFDDIKLIQKLIGCRAICEECHNAIHFGRSQSVGLEKQAFAHLQKINGWSEEDTKNHVKSSFREWVRRDRFHYKLDLSYLLENNLISKRNIHWAWLDRPKRVRDRLDALSWSQTLLELPYAVILDTETTGLIEGPEKNPNAEVVELAIISVKGKTLYNGRFRPLYEIPSHVIGIHGITNDAVKKSPAFANEYEKIQKILHGKIVVAYNSKFDQKIIANTCRIHDIPMPDNLSWECAMWVYKGYMESPQFLRLPHGKHSALADCKA